MCPRSRSFDCLLPSQHVVISNLRRLLRLVLDHTRIDVLGKFRKRDLMSTDAYEASELIFKQEKMLLTGCNRRAPAAYFGHLRDDNRAAKNIGLYLQYA